MLGLVLTMALACLPARKVVTPSGSGPGRRIAELWIEPESGRDLLHGVGGRRLTPDPGVRYRVIRQKVHGFSDGYTVIGPDDRQWSAKFPPEAATEVVASRLTWGAGYHQPPIYFMRAWQAEGADRPNPQLPSRFREKDPDLHGLDETGDWSFYDNPFVGTTELNGLLVLQAILGNPDLKDSNNSLYELDEPADGAARWYVVRDLGYSFGQTALFGGLRGDIDAFERAPFIRAVRGDLVELTYHGRHGALYSQIRVDDVRWICRRLSAFTDEQWEDAFRAGGFERENAARFIRRLKAKVAEGLALRRES